MESDFIAWLRNRLPPHPHVRLGIGDDAAILRLGSRAECVVTVDLLNDGVDFELASIDPRRAGRKALAASLSDLAAMAARPVAVVVALALPRRGGGELAVALFEGMIPLAERYATAIAGGDTNSWDGPLAISVTAFGEVTPRGALLRGGARPGDRVLVTGEFGGSILGKHLDFEPRVHEALLLNERYELHAGMDCSDGLSLDLSRLAAESGCGVVLDTARVPVADAARELARRNGTDQASHPHPGPLPSREREQGESAGADSRSALEHALADGEDFELILAVPPNEAARMLAEQPLGPLRLTDIGQFVAELGLWEIRHDGQRRPLAARGYEHGFD